ncbi:B-box zinc finger protein [Asaia bogorensis]|uniref:B-box zinc finger protein n=1 Tax=Asaia bogorensis TaxID=91915 RepID=UPI0038D028EE
MTYRLFRPCQGAGSRRVHGGHAEFRCLSCNQFVCGFCRQTHSKHTASTVECALKMAAMIDDRDSVFEAQTA